MSATPSLSGAALHEQAIALRHLNPIEITERLIDAGASPSDASAEAGFVSAPIERPAPRTRRKRSTDLQLPAVGDPVRAIAAAHLGCADLDEVDGKHAAVVVAVLDSLATHDVFVDALGGLRRNGTRELAALTIPALSTEIAFKLRCKFPLDLGYVIETFQHLARLDSDKRRQDILLPIIGLPELPEGVVELRRWVRAVTGTERESDVQAMRHWLWCVKRKQSGRTAERHVMLVLVGRQGGGKSKAVAQLASVWDEMAKPAADASDLIDERKRPWMARYAVGIFDELCGMGRADAAAVKAAVTADAITYRPMRSNTDTKIPVLVSLIGTSNEPIAEIIRDPTGNRRFYGLRTQDRIDWDAINDIDYFTLWTAADERQPAPGVEHAAIIAAAQAGTAYRDPVSRWLDDADLGGGRLLCADVWESFRLWAEANGERPGTSAGLGARLAEKGWRRSRQRLNGGLAYAYEQPDRGSCQEHREQGEQGAGGLSREGVAVPGVPGVPRELLYPFGDAEVAS